jgi:hypothetical protein
MGCVVQRADSSTSVSLGLRVRLMSTIYESLNWSFASWHLITIALRSCHPVGVREAIVVTAAWAFHHTPVAQWHTVLCFRTFELPQEDFDRYQPVITLVESLLQNDLPVQWPHCSWTSWRSDRYSPAKLSHHLRYGVVLRIPPGRSFHISLAHFSFFASQHTFGVCVCVLPLTFWLHFRISVFASWSPRHEDLL